MTLASVSVRPGPAGFAWLCERIAEAQASDPLAPVTVIVPNHYTGLWLRRELSQTGYVNVRFEVLARLAERLGARALAEAGRAPLRSVIEDAVIREAIQDARAGFGDVGAHPALVDTLRDLFHTLREHEVGAEQIARWRMTGRTADAALAAFTTYERLIESERLYDDRAALDAAATAAAAASLREIGLVALYLPTRLTPAAARFVRALAQQCDVRAALAATGDPLADQEMRANAAALGIEHTDSAAAGTLPERRVLLAPDPGEEVRAVVRDILGDLRGGTRLDRIGVLYRAREPYAAVLRETLDVAGLPWAGLEGRPLSDSVVARALLAVLGLRDREFARVDVLEWRSALPHAGHGDVSFAEWNRLTREAGIVRGADQWRERLMRLAKELRKSTERTNLSEAARAHYERRADRAERIATRVAELAAATEPPPERTWPAYVAWALSLRERFVVPHREPNEEDAAKLVDEALCGLGAASSLGGEVTPEIFRHALDAALRGQRRPQGKIGVGVVVGQIAAARGIVFDRLYVVGMADGLFPPRPSADPIFPDDDPLERRAERAADERSAFVSALAGADGGVVQCSAPVWDPDVRPAYAAPWLLEIAQQVTSVGLTSAELRTGPPRGWRRVPSPEGALATVSEPLDLAECRTADARTWGARHVLEQSGLGRRTDLPLGRALELRNARRSDALTAFDGGLQAAAASSPRLSRGLASTLISASAIERWCTCPFHYFLERVLYVEATVQPEDDEAWTILPAAKGSLVHDVLERFMRELTVTGRPRPHETYTRADHARIDEIADAVFVELEVQGVTGYALAWENERAAIRRDLHTFLTKDEQYRQQGGFVPVYFEQGFGMKDDESWPVATISLADGTDVRLRGAIDRVDVAPDRDHPERAMVTDYKTGHVESTELKKDPVRAGRSIQLALYSRVVRDHFRALGVSAPQIIAAYWQIASRHKFARTELAADNALDTRLQAVLETVHGAVAGGAFPQRPGAEDVRPERMTWGNCAYCEYDRVCPAARGQLAERKENDPSVALHRGLSLEDP